MDLKLKTAFRWHLQNMPRYRHGFGEGLADAPRAVFALAMARRDVAAGITRYPAPVKPFPAFGAPDESGRRWSEKPESAGLRLVGRVEAGCGRRNGIWDNRESSGWYADECQDNLCYGLVYQLPGRNGESRFVAGYAFSDDCGATLDLRRIRAFCETFQGDNAALLAQAYARPDYDETQAGRDLWFTSQGNGVGYWDRKELNIPGAVGTGLSIGQKLSDAARYPEAQVWFAGHVTYGDAPFVHVEI